MNLWGIYLICYTISAFSYLWYRYIFLLAPEDRSVGNYSGLITVIIPFYNEKQSLLQRTVNSIHNCYGNKQIIIIDDGSNSKECCNGLLELKKQIPFELIRYERNLGKRHAQSLGFEKAKGDIIITVDSDTILEKDALVNLIKPFSDEKIGATTGQLEIMNRDDNILTKMQNARYWNAFNFERKSQSKVGALNCCSGPISAYKKSIIDEIKEEYSKQYFLGNKCTYGDDRHLTTLILKKGYCIKYVPSAKGYTDAPTTLKKLIKQQIRWKKSWLRENYLVSKFMFKRSKALSFEIFLTTFIAFFSIFARIGLIVSLIMMPLYILWVIPMILFMGTVHSLYVLFHKPKYFIYSVLYAFVHAFIIYWLVFVALFTLKKTGWGTR